MIGKLTGLLDSIGEGSIILDVGGVGYEVACSSRTLQTLPSKGDPLTLFIETHVRETEIRLFGFRSEFGRLWFRKLQSVQGVGAKVAMAILGTLTADDLANAITLGDKAMVSQAPGVGPKVATRICQELKDKIPVPATLDGRAPTGTPMAAPQTASSEDNSTARGDAISALTNLGYQPLAASQAIAKAMSEADDGASAETLIRLGLKELAG